MSYVIALKILFLVKIMVATVMATGHSLIPTEFKPEFQYAVEEYPEFLFQTNELAEYLGYPCEIHQVTTQDGYILKVFRIPHGKSGPGTYSERPPVYVQHGIISSSDEFVLNREDQSLGFMLADAGFDVWLGNFRGNKYSLEHVPPLSAIDFFDFSFDEMGEYDVPNTIDYILEVTGYSDLQYIGHSMGSTACLAMLSTKPEYNAKVRHFHALAPVAWLDHVRTPFVLVAPYANQLKVLAYSIHLYEFLPNYDFIKLFGLGCRTIYPAICKGIYGIAGGPNPQQLNTTRMPVIYSHHPAGTSIMSIVHFGQIINSGKFQKYDYGPVENLLKYGQVNPPEYNVSKVTTKVSLYWSDNDWLVGQEDVAHLRDELPNWVDYHRVPYSLYSHYDFLYAINNAEFLNNYLISKLERY